MRSRPGFHESPKLRGYAEGEYGTHEFVLPWRFPYTIVYQIKQNWIVIVAIAHQSKEPAYWSHRT